MKKFLSICLISLVSLSATNASAKTSTQQTSSREVVTTTNKTTTSTQKVSAVQSTVTTQTSNQQTPSQQTVVVQEPTKVQKAESKVTLTTTRFLTDVDCNECAKKIIEKISKDSGVTSVDVVVKTRIVTVTYDISKNSDAKIIKKLNKIGFSAKIIK